MAKEMEMPVETRDEHVTRSLENSLRSRDSLQIPQTRSVGGPDEQIFYSC
jgi:hypothetical protein